MLFEAYDSFECFIFSGEKAAHDEIPAVFGKWIRGLHGKGGRQKDLLRFLERG